MENYIVGLGETLFDCLPDGKKLGVLLQTLLIT